MHHLVLGATSGSGNTKVTIFAGGVSETDNAKLILFGNNQHQMSGSLDISGSLTVGGTITAQTLIVQTITSSVDYVTGSTIFGSQLSNTHQFTGSVSITGSLNAPIITGSLFGTASWAQNAVTASYVAAANVAGLSLFQITTGSITASVGFENDLFLIRSGSKTYFNISSSGETTLYSSNFSVKDFTTNETVFQISGSKAYFDFDGITIATQSVAPTGSASVGGILFTSTAMYIGLE
jgi:cytoskeletal protein CcmA (bactofilin family)